MDLNLVLAVGSLCTHCMVPPPMTQTHCRVQEQCNLLTITSCCHLVNALIINLHLVSVWRNGVLRDVLVHCDAASLSPSGGGRGNSADLVSLL